MSDLRTYLSAMVERGGSDLHLVANRVPRVRIDGSLLPLDGLALSVADLEGLVKEASSGVPSSFVYRSVAGPPPIDFTLHIESLGRFRCHLYSQGGLPALVIRFIPLHIPSLKALGFPQMFGDLTKVSQGLVIVAGPAGSGKSTTLAAFLDKLNGERRAHMLTLEQPIEFLHSDKKGMVSQREVGVDVPDFFAGLQAAMREDSDVVMVEAHANRETIDAALSLAESGKLVLLALQTSSCLLALQELMQCFSPDQQHFIRYRLAMTLEGVIAQVLLPRSKAAGRVLALEILMPTTAVRGLIREDKIRQIYSIMQTGQAKHGMQTMNQALVDLYRRRLISASAALGYSSLPDELRQMIQRTDARLRE